MRVVLYCGLVPEVGEVIAKGEDDFSDFAGLLACWIMCHDDSLFSSNANHSFFSLQISLSQRPMPAHHRHIEDAGVSLWYLSALNGLIISPNSKILIPSNSKPTPKNRITMIEPFTNRSNLRTTQLQSQTVII